MYEFEKRNFRQKNWINSTEFKETTQRLTHTMTTLTGDVNPKPYMIAEAVQAKFNHMHYNEYGSNTLRSFPNYALQKIMYSFN